MDGREPEWSEETDEQLRAHPIDRADTSIVSAYADESIDEDEPPWLRGLSFGDGTDRDYLGGFAMYGSAYNADLAADLGCTLGDDGAIDVDENRETSVDGVYAVGDVTHGQNQTTIAIGDGAYAGIAIHKDLRRFPKSLEELKGDETPMDNTVPGTAPNLRAQMQRVRDLKTHPGLRGPSPEQE